MPVRLRSAALLLALAGPIAALPASAHLGHHAGTVHAKVQAAAQTCTPVFSTGMNLVAERPMLQVDVNDHQVQALLDTGTTLNVVQTADAASTLDLKRVGTSGKVHRFGAPIVRFPTLQGRVQVEGKTLHKTLFMQAVLPHLDPETIIVGSQALSGFDVVLDHKDGQLRGYRPGSCRGGQPLGADAVRMIIPRRFGNPRLSATLNGVRLEGLLDTGSIGVTISPAAARRVGITDAMLAAAPHIKHYTTGGAEQDTQRVPLKSFILAGKVFTRGTVTVREMKDDIVVGEDALKHFDILMPADAREVYLKLDEPASPAPPPETAQR